LKYGSIVIQLTPSSQLQCYVKESYNIYEAFINLLLCISNLYFFVIEHVINSIYEMSVIL